jgi:hypothetical protein
VSSASSTAVPTSNDSPADGTLDVDLVDDPDGTIRLVGVNDTITVANAHRLLDAADGVDRRVTLHLDFSQASIPTNEALWRLEASIDELERRGYGLRVVGVDPEHPALVAAAG